MAAGADVSTSRTGGKSGEASVFRREMASKTKRSWRARDTMRIVASFSPVAAGTTHSSAKGKPLPSAPGAGRLSRLRVEAERVRGGVHGRMGRKPGDAPVFPGVAGAELRGGAVGHAQPPQLFGAEGVGYGAEKGKCGERRDSSCGHFHDITIIANTGKNSDRQTRKKYQILRKSLAGCLLKILRTFDYIYDFCEDIVKSQQVFTITLDYIMDY